MPRSTRLLATLSLIALVSFAALTPAAMAAGAPTNPSDPTTDLAALEPLQPKRTGRSENEPDFCPTTVTREAPNLSATNTNSLEAGPSTFMVKDLEPGTIYRHCIYILNRKTSTRTFEITTADVIGSTDPRISIDTTEAKVVGTWITPLLTKLTLAPGERIKIPYTITVPDQPPVGSVAGAIRIGDVTSATGGATAVRNGLGLQVQTTFPGGVSKKITVKGEQWRRLLVRSKDSPRVRTRYVVLNDGTVIGVIRQRLVVEGLFGKKVGGDTLPDDVLAPGSAQNGVMVWDDVPWIGRYSARIEVQSEAGTTVVPLPTLWILPPWPVLIAFVVALLLAVFGIVRRRQRTGWRAYLDVDDEADEADDWTTEGDPYR